MVAMHKSCIKLKHITSLNKHKHTLTHTQANWKVKVRVNEQNRNGNKGRKIRKSPHALAYRPSAQQKSGQKWSNVYRRCEWKWVSLFCLWSNLWRLLLCTVNIMNETLNTNTSQMNLYKAVTWLFQAVYAARSPNRTSTHINTNPKGFPFWSLNTDNVVIGNSQEKLLTSHIHASDTLLSCKLVSVVL